jgi:hypothetical protein
MNNPSGVWLLQLVIPAAAGLLGVLAGGWMTGRHQKRERQQAYVRERLSGFYAPLLSLRSQIRLKSELRLKLSGMANAAWQKRLESVRHDPQALIATERARGPQFDQLFEYSDKQLIDELVPLYREMLGYFQSHRWLAEPSTLAHLDALVEYVEMWNRFLAGTLPHEVLELVDHHEKKLYPLYADLETQEQKLRAELRK